MKDLIDSNYENLILLALIVLGLFLFFNISNLVFVFLRKLYRILKNRLPYGFKRRFHKLEPIGKFLRKFTKFNLKTIAFFNALFLFIILGTLCCIYTRMPKILSSNPSQNGIWENPENYIEVEFSRPIKVEDVKMNLAPEIKGEWKSVRTFNQLPFVTKMRFYPEETIFPGEEVIIYAVGYNPKTIGETMIEFKSPELPEVSTTNFEGDASINFPLDENFQFTMVKKVGDFVQWEAEVDPGVEFEITQDRDANTISISPKSRLALDTVYNIKLYRQAVSYKISDKSIVDRKERELVYEGQLHTDTSPVVSAFSPSGNQVFADTAIAVDLGKVVNKEEFESKFRMDPVIEGTFQWESDQRVIFTPNSPLEKATKYNVIIGAGLEYAPNISTKTDIVFDFETIGYARVANFNINPGSTGISVGANIEVSFDQEVDHESAQGAFSLSPNVTGAFSWDGNRMIFNPGSYLEYSKKYNVSIKPGVKSIYGLDSNEEFTTSFTTASQVFSISVPYYRQSDRFECELLALRMALAYRGIYMSAGQIMNEIGVSSVPYDAAANTWGNPNTSFVGDVTGASKGYGVHLDPLARVARNHGRNATVHRGWTASGIAQEVKNGNPVVILWQNGWSSPTNISWKTPEGTNIYAINGTHAGVVVGFKGPVEAPYAMIVQDPWYRGGSTRTYTISSFNGLWSYHGNSALVIY